MRLWFGEVDAIRRLPQLRTNHPVKSEQMIAYIARISTVQHKRPLSRPSELNSNPGTDRAPANIRALASTTPRASGHDARQSGAEEEQGCGLWNRVRSSERRLKRELVRRVDVSKRCGI